MCSAILSRNERRSLSGRISAVKEKIRHVILTPVVVTKRIDCDGRKLLNPNVTIGSTVFGRSAMTNSQHKAFPALTRYRDCCEHNVWKILPF